MAAYDQRGIGMLRVLIVLVVLAALVAGYFWAAMKWSYASGDRAGWVQKLSRKGWVCKTWEGELAMVSMPGTTQEKFYFTVWDDEVAARINKAMGQRVSLHQHHDTVLTRAAEWVAHQRATHEEPATQRPMRPELQGRMRSSLSARPRLRRHPGDGPRADQEHRQRSAPARRQR